MTRLRAAAAHVAAREVARALRGGDVGVGALDGALGDRGREALGAACRTARECGLHGEHVVLALKDVWRTLPEAQPLPRREAEAALARLVTACITTFYRRADASSQTRAPARTQTPVPPSASSGRGSTAAVHPTL